MRRLLKNGRGQGERGASLLLALGFLALCGVLIPAVVNLSSTNLSSTNKLAAQRGVVYSADGAVDATIQYLRLNTACGRVFESTACPLHASGDTFTATLNGQTVNVVFAAAPDAGPLDLDRKIKLAATVGGKDRVDSTVIIHDGAIDASTGSPYVPGKQPVDVKSWTYNR